MIDRALLERIPAATAVISALSLLLSITHEWGFFYVIGLRWLSTFGVKDYLSLAVEWLPVCFAICILLLIFSVGTDKLISSQTKNSMQGWSAAAGSLCTLILAMVFAADDSRLFLFSLTFPFVWISLFLMPIWTKAKSNLGNYFLILIALPPVVSVAFSIGVSDGKKSLAWKIPQSVIVTRTETIHATILRNVDRGVIALDVANARVVLAPWEEVLSVSQKLPSDMREPVPCVVRVNFICDAFGAVERFSR